MKLFYYIFYCIYQERSLWQNWAESESKSSLPHCLWKQKMRSSKDQEVEVLSADIISPKPISAFGVFNLR